VTSVDVDGSGIRTNSGSAITTSGSLLLSLPSIANVRISGDANDAIADTGSTTVIYIHPYNGNLVSLYDGTNWIPRSFSKFSYDVTGLSSGTMCDMFLYWNGTSVAASVVAWTNSTTRAEVPVYQDGVLVRPSGNEGYRYIGTFYLRSGLYVVNTDNQRDIWNYYNRRRTSLKRRESVNTWTYTTAAWRAWNNNSSSSVKFVVGYAEDIIEAKARLGVGSSSSFMTAGIGLNRTTANDADGAVGAGGNGVAIADMHEYPREGENTVYGVEYGSASGSPYGDGATTYLNSYLSAAIWS
jgi:hypothetical protein